MDTRASDKEKLSAEADLGPRSPLRTVQVLHELAVNAAGVPLAVLAQRLQLPKTSLFRLLRSLEGGGYVTSDNGVHRVGPAALKLGAAIVHNRQFPNCAKPVMQWLAEQFDETVILGTLADNGTDIIYIEVIEATRPLRFSTNPGTIKPLYSSANGLAILAHLPTAELAAYLKKVRFTRLAPKTISSVAELKSRLAQARGSGAAVSEEGMFEGVFSVAAPLADATGAVRNAVSVSAPCTRGIPQEAAFSALVLQAGEEISRLLGYSGPYPPPA